MRPLLLAMLASCVLLAQPEPIIRSTTKLVEVRVVTTDRNGNLVPNLRKEDFEIFDNGRRQPITFFSTTPTNTSLNPDVPQAGAATNLPTEYTVVLPNPQIGEAIGRYDARFGGNQGSPSVEQQIFDWTNRIEDTLIAFSEVANRLASLPGKKWMIWLSLGFPETINERVVPGSKSAPIVFVNRVAKALA